MKALEKDRTRRYESAGDFARDVQRFLDGEPVEACPPSAGYRLRKFASKHRSALAAAAAFAGLLVVAVMLSTWQAIRATRAEKRALLEGSGQPTPRRSLGSNATMRWRRESRPNDPPPKPGRC